MALPTASVLSLFSGIGGLDLGVKLASPGTRVVCYVERDAYAAATLVARMEEAILDQAPIWDDVSTFDGRPWLGKVDTIIGGFPCQDISDAGRRAGIVGAKSSLWREYARIIDEIRPCAVFIENVAAIVKRGLEYVLEDLARLGFDAEWDLFSASEAGAPHRRERLFLLAYARATLADSPGAGLEGPNRDANASRDQLPLEPLCGSFAAFPPGPYDGDAWARVLAEMPDTKPAVCRVAYGFPSRVDRFRTLGNAVVPLVAARAWSELWARALAR